MHSTRDDDSFAQRKLYGLWVKIGDDDNLNIVACVRLAQHCLPNFILILVGSDLVYIFAQISERVRETMRQVAVILIVGKLNLKRQTVQLLFLHVAIQLLPLALRGIIGYLVTIPVPTYLLLLSFLYRVNQRLHSLIVGAAFLHEVADVELVCLIGPCVTDPKEIPLCVRLSAIVCLEEEIVLVLLNFDGLLEIAWFKAWLELKRCVVTVRNFVVGLQLRVVTI